MNRIIIIGNVVHTPKGATTKNGISNSRFSVAVQRKYKNDQGGYDADFFNVVAWRQTADFVNKYVDKGRRVAVEGRLETRTYDGKDGEKKYATEIIADTVEALGGGEKKKEDNFKEVDDEPLPWEA